MTNLTYNGQIIDQRQSDSFVNLTQMAKANNARLDKWQESPDTQKYLKALQESISPESGFSVLEIKSVGFPAVKTTWGHPLVAIAFGQWISPEFHVWCNMHIKTLIETGKTELSSQPALPQSYKEALLALVAEIEKRELLEAEKQLLESENHQLSEAVDELFNYSSIIRIAKFNHCSEKSFEWRKLKATTLAMKLEVKRVPCPRFGEKLLYPHDAWRYVYPDYQLPETTTLVVKR